MAWKIIGNNCVINEGCTRIEKWNQNLIVKWKILEVLKFMEQQYRNLIQLLLDECSEFFFAFLSNVEKNWLNIVYKIFEKDRSKIYGTIIEI